MKKNHNIYIIACLIVLLLLVVIGLYSRSASRQTDGSPNEINSFSECAEAGNPIMESYPERCSAGGKSFTNPDQKVINP